MTLVMVAASAAVLRSRQYEALDGLNTSVSLDKNLSVNTDFSKAPFFNLRMLVSTCQCQSL